MVTLTTAQYELSANRHIKRREMAGGAYRGYPAGETIFEAGDRKPRTFYLVSGWVVSWKLLSNGTRMVSDFLLPGDIVWTASSQLSRETIQALSNIRIYELPPLAHHKSQDATYDVRHAVLIEMVRRQARLSERMASIGRRDAFSRTAHLLLELAVRLGVFEQDTTDGFECPLTQSEIGDAVGLSTVHINRVLRDMRLNNLLLFKSGIVEFLDRQKLEELVDFDPSYLDSSIAEARV
jgi:CRP-like cAMP-binding protein